MRGPTHVHCFECGNYTQVNIGDDPVELPCWYCIQIGDDGWVTEPVIIFPCPGGVTADDWYEKNYELCDDENHEWRTGNHVVALEP